MGDVRAELFSGDPAKQTGALMNALAALAAGRDVAPLVSAALQLLGNPATAPEVKRAAYDLALTATAQLSDAGARGGVGRGRASCLPPSRARRPWVCGVRVRCSAATAGTLAARPADLARLAAAVQADLQRGSPHEVRLKALAALPGLPGHRLAALLADGKVLERLVSAAGFALAVLTKGDPALPGLGWAARWLPLRLGSCNRGSVLRRDAPCHARMRPAGAVAAQHPRRRARRRHRGRRGADAARADTGPGGRVAGGAGRAA